MRLPRSIGKKIEAIAATGMPGGYKLVVFFALETYFGLDVLGGIATWQAIAQILGFFTAIGWCSVMLVRVAKADTDAQRVATYNSVAIMSIATLLATSAACALAGILFSIEAASIHVVVWVFAWTVYQLPRHYLIAQRKYRRAIGVDGVVIGSSLICITQISQDYISIALASCMAISGLVSSIAIQFTTHFERPQLHFDIKGLEYGLANLLSGGVALSLVPAANLLSGADFAGAISLFLAISGIALLLPRALSLNQLPTLAKSISFEKAKAMITTMKREITRSNLITTGFCASSAALLAYSYADRLDAIQLIVALAAITLQYAVGGQTLIYANILMSLERASLLLKTNIASALIYSSAATTILLYKPRLGFAYICCAAALASVYRFIKLRRRSEQAYARDTTV